MQVIPISWSFCSQCLSVSQLLKNNRFLLASYFSLFLFWASLSHFLFTPGLAAVWNLIGHAWCSHGCLLWCGSSQGLILHQKEQSEFRMVLNYNMRTIMRNGYEFLEKMKTSHFFSIRHLGRYLCCFYGTFTFFIGKTDKTDSFQELWVQKMYLIRKLVRDRTADVFF